MSGGLHPSHKTRISLDASTYDEICTVCGAHDEVPGGWGQLAFPCPGEEKKPAEKVKCPALTATIPPTTL